GVAPGALPLLWGAARGLGHGLVCARRHRNRRDAGHAGTRGWQTLRRRGRRAWAAHHRVRHGADERGREQHEHGAEAPLEQVRLQRVQEGVHGVTLSIAVAVGVLAHDVPEDAAIEYYP